MNTNSTQDFVEIAKFTQHADEWWSVEGPLKTLHDINPVRLTYIEQFIQFNKQPRILDVGCGGGILSEAMAVKGAVVTGLDVNDAAICCAKAHALQNHVTIDYVCQPIESFVAEQFDAITCLEMLEHVQEPQFVIEHCARLLKPDGYLFLSTLNRTLTAYATAVIAAEYIMGLIPRQTHDFDKFIKPSELAQMLRANDLDVIGLTGLAYNPLTRQAALHQDVSVNYLVACQKS